MSDLVDATPGACTQFVQSLGLPELKAKRLLAALGGAAQGEVLPAIAACKHTRTHVCPSCHGLWWVALSSRLHVALRSARTATSCVSCSGPRSVPTPMAMRYNSQRLQNLHRTSNQE